MIKKNDKVLGDAGALVLNKYICVVSVYTRNCINSWLIFMYLFSNAICWWPRIIFR